jgi:RHS repeat-associated protein
VDVVTGANTDITIDFRLRGPLPLYWRRYYNSARNTVACPLGWGHTHDFDQTLTYDLDGLHYNDPSGSEIPFPPLTVGEHAATAGFLLRRVTTRIYELTLAGQPVQEFEFTGSRTAPLRRLRRRKDEIKFYYGPDGRLREIIDSRRQSVNVESDRNGRILGLFLRAAHEPSRWRTLMLYEYDVAGNMVVGRDQYNAALGFRWDEQNRMTRRTDRLGYSFHFKYDDKGRCTHSRGDDGLLEVSLDYHPQLKTTFVRRGDGGLWVYAYNDNETITQITDPEGHATKFILDELGRPVQEVDPNGNVTTIHYDWRGGIDYRLDPNGNVLSAEENNLNRDGSSEDLLPTTALEWDFGRLIDANIIRPPSRNDPLLTQFPVSVVNTLGIHTAAGASSSASSATEEALHSTDDFDRPLEHIGPSFSQRWKYDANGNLIEHRDRDGSLYRYVYKSWNALWQSIDPLGNVVSFDLTVQGLMGKVTDPGGTITEYGYNLREELVEVREMGQLVESYRRDPAGNVIEKTDASGRTLVAWEVGSGNLDKLQVLRSGEKHVFEHDANGRIIECRSPSGTTTFAYDRGGNLLADQRDGKGVVHEFEFVGLTTTTYFDKFKVSYRTLANGDRVVQDPTGARHQFQFGKTGLIAKFLANGSRELCEFDSDGRCLRKAVVRTSWDSAPWIRSFEYSAAGDLLTIIDNVRGTRKYCYDAAHRLVEEKVPSDGSQRLFEFDNAGNLIRQPGLSNVVIGDGNRLKEANGEILTYNERLNLVQRRGPSGTILYEYNDLDMLVRCDIRGETWTATYDGLCRRVQKTWRGQTTSYYWDGIRLAAEVRHNGSCRIYIYADDTALSPFLFVDYESSEAAPESGTRYYVFTNQISAPICVEDDAGRQVWSAQIDPYGKAQVDLASTIEMPLRFPGHYFDRETGLHYNGFRYFSPELGRYLESDPAGLAGGINAYAYRHRPLITVDINGLAKKSKQKPKTKEAFPADKGCKEKALAALSGELENNPDPNKYPKRGGKHGQEANQAGRQVHQALAATDGDHRVVAVYTHKDGSRSVGISGITLGRAKEIEDHLNKNNGSPPTTSGQQKWRVRGDVDDNLSRCLTDDPKRRIEASNCAEPRAASAAHSNEQPITGFSTTPSKDYSRKLPDPPKPSPPGECGPCVNCGKDPGNEGPINRHANTTGNYDPNEPLYD